MRSRRSVSQRSPRRSSTLLLLLALSVAIALHAVFAVKLVMLIGALLLVVLRALWVRLQPPDGEPLARGDAPELFALLDRLRARLNTPPLHQVLVTADFNAGITQVPRLGVFGWHRNYLILGLPLMRCVSAPQLEAVAAYEVSNADTQRWLAAALSRPTSLSDTHPGLKERLQALSTEAQIALPAAEAAADRVLLGERFAKLASTFQRPGLIARMFCPCRAAAAAG